MTLNRPPLTSGKVIQAFYEEHAAYMHDDKKYGGRKSLCVVGLDNHLIIGSRAKDFCMKWLAHELGNHKFCLEIPEEKR